MKNKVYRSKPLAYRQWRQVRKEMLALVLVVAALFAIDSILYVAAHWGLVATNVLP